MLRCAALFAVLGLLSMSQSAAGAEATRTKADPFADNACIQCHRDLAGRSNEIVELEWKHSVHASAGVACDGCHGGNAALKREQFTSDDAFKRAAHLERSTEFTAIHGSVGTAATARGRSISYFCGKCHSKIKEQHLGSPHGEFGQPTCLFCHGQGTHRISAATPAIIDTRGRLQRGRCSPCHKAATMQAVTRIKGILIDTEEQIRSSGKLYKELESWGYRNLELEKLDHHAAEVRSQLRQVFHSFNMRDINNISGEIQAAVDRTTATHEMIGRLRDAQRQQTIIGALAVVVLLSFAALLLYYKKNFLLHSSEHLIKPKPSDPSSPIVLGRLQMND